ncbi:MAG: alkaline phosphatase family protein [Sandaracinaceae bacterium]
MSARHLVVGLDGADWAVIDAIGPASLPTLHRLRAGGAWARLRSVQPPATLPNWTTFLTGVDPGDHGVFDFTTRAGYRVEFTAGTAREAPSVASRLDRLGLRAAVIGFPATWPPERLRHGIFVSGWDSPVAFDADRSFCWPPSLHGALEARFGALRFDDVDEFDAERPGWHDRLPAALVERVRRRADLAEWLLGREPWDLFAVYFGESDTASHHLWALHDPASPRHPRGTRPAERLGLERVYRALDAALSRLVAAAGRDVGLTVVSDHGSGGSSDRVLYLNRVLAEAGLLAFRPGSTAGALAGWAKDQALTRLPARARQAAFGLAGRALPGWLESQARFGALDLARTQAFSEELNYFPSVSLNIVGREPLGTVRQAERADVVRRVTEVLLALRDPWSGTPIVRSVWPREDLFSGPYVTRAPDLLLDLHLDPRGYSYNLMPSGQAPPGTGPWRRLGPEEHLGRKGRSLPGSHRPRGLLLLHGPRVQPVGEIEARIADATATLLARMDVDPGPELAGRVLREAVPRAGSTVSRALPAAPPPSRQVGDRQYVEARLRALGYVD